MNIVNGATRPATPERIPWSLGERRIAQAGAARFHVAAEPSRPAQILAGRGDQIVPMSRSVDPPGVGQRLLGIKPVNPRLAVRIGPRREGDAAGAAGVLDGERDPV